MTRNYHSTQCIDQAWAGIAPDLLRMPADLPASGSAIEVCVSCVLSLSPLREVNRVLVVMNDQLLTVLPMAITSLASSWPSEAPCIGGDGPRMVGETNLTTGSLDAYLGDRGVAQCRCSTSSSCVVDMMCHRDEVNIAFIALEEAWAVRLAVAAHHDFTSEVGDPALAPHDRSRFLTA